MVPCMLAVSSCADLPCAREVAACSMLALLLCACGLQHAQLEAFKLGAAGPRTGLTLCQLFFIQSCPTCRAGLLCLWPQHGGLWRPARGPPGQGCPESGQSPGRSRHRAHHDSVSGSRPAVRLGVPAVNEAVASAVSYDHAAREDTAGRPCTVLVHMPGACWPPGQALGCAAPVLQCLTCASWQQALALVIK